MAGFHKRRYLPPTCQQDDRKSLLTEQEGSLDRVFQRMNTGHSSFYLKVALACVLFYLALFGVVLWSELQYGMPVAGSKIDHVVSSKLQHAPPVEKSGNATAEERAEREKLVSQLLSAFNSVNP